MKKLKVLLDFIQLAVVAKIAFYHNVLACLTNNALFPTPDVALAEVKAAVDKLSASDLAARDGGRTAIATRNADEKAADELFHILAAYVDRIASGDEVKILSSGFQITKQPVAPQKAPLTVLDGANSGSVKLMAKAIDKAGSYIWQMAKGTQPAAEEGWSQIGITTQASFELKDLEVGGKYYFRVAAVTNIGVTDYTAGVLKVVV